MSPETKGPTAVAWSPALLLVVLSILSHEPSHSAFSDLLGEVICLGIQGGTFLRVVNLLVHLPVMDQTPWFLSEIELQAVLPHEEQVLMLKMHQDT